MSLLPRHHVDFHSKEYWDDFFRQRGDEAFEWYGTCLEMQSLLQRYMPMRFVSQMTPQTITQTNGAIDSPAIRSPANSATQASLSSGYGSIAQCSDRILIIGCGNSNFSSDLYDMGYTNITNLDFSELVIEDMRRKNSYRVHMRWDIGDMTKMDLYQDKSYDIVIDKGALDALMSANTDEIQWKVQSMFREIERVLSDTGKYICITLAENFIFDAILEYFSKSLRWCVTIEMVDSSRPSPFKTFFLLISKVKNPTSPLAGIIRLTVDNLGKPIPKPKTQPIDNVKDTIASIQGFAQRQYEIADLKVGRYDIIEIFSSNSSHEGSSSTIPRFSLIVSDIAAAKSHGMQGLCGVFFIPQGREHEYQFSTAQGLSMISQQAGFCRLISVRLHRPHHYGKLAMHDIQAELSPIIVSLAPRSCDPGSIPFMSIQSDSDWEIIDRGISPQSGEYIVEESKDEDSPDNRIVRRLIFLQNQNFIQTEARLVTNHSKGQKKSSTNKNKSKSAAKQGDESVDEEFDFRYLDSHHSAALIAFIMNPTIVDNYTNSNNDITPGEVRGLVIGLGGGAFAMALQRYLPGLPFVVCDIDPSLPDIAEKYFGYRNIHHRCNISIENGIDLINRYYDRSMDEGLGDGAKALSYIYIDVDSKDSSLGLSAPPPEFIEQGMLDRIHSMLIDGGIIVINVVARQSDLLMDLIGKVKVAFLKTELSTSSESSVDLVARPGRVFSLKPSDETVNVTLIAIKGSTSKDTAAKGKSNAIKGKKDGSKTEETVLWNQILGKWLRAVGLDKDPLELGDLVRKIQEH